MAWLDALRSTPGLSDADVNRYGTKPLLIFVEAYVLDSIGQLGPDKLALAKKMASRAFGASPDWKLAIRNVLGLEESFDDEVREIWQQNLEQFHNQGLRADPIAFARAFADENFAKSPQPSKSFELPDADHHELGRTRRREPDHDYDDAQLDIVLGHRIDVVMHRS